MFNPQTERERLQQNRHKWHNKQHDKSLLEMCSGKYKQFAELLTQHKSSENADCGKATNYDPPLLFAPENNTRTHTHKRTEQPTKMNIAMMMGVHTMPVPTHRSWSCYICAGLFGRTKKSCDKNLIAQRIIKFCAKLNSKRQASYKSLQHSGLDRFVLVALNAFAYGISLWGKQVVSMNVDIRTYTTGFPSFSPTTSTCVCVCVRSHNTSHIFHGWKWIAHILWHTWRAQMVYIVLAEWFSKMYALIEKSESERQYRNGEWEI